MITMTSAAHQVVRQVTSHPRVGRLSGLRIAATDHGTDGLSVQTVAGPRAGDRVLEHVLDAVTEDTGRIQFVVKGS